MPEARRCPQCGTAVRPDAPEGLCPECLLKEAMKSGSDLGHEPNATATHAFGSNPPSLEDLAKQFPQLEILELLGQGGMGIVYKAHHPRLDRFVALKILPAEAGRDSAFAERFAREARALAKLTHPSIVAVYDFGESEGRFHLLMEFVDGVNLRYLLRERRLKPEEALKIVPQICEALQYAHDQGVVHRDIKPENILLDKMGHVKIADFGLAKLLGTKTADSALTGPQQIMGTPHYMAPEQMERPLAVDHRADIYSLGVVFYEMLTGELPLGRFAPPSQKVQVDVRLDEVVLRALEKEPERRYQHASEVKTEVEFIGSRQAEVAAHSPWVFLWAVPLAICLFVPVSVLICGLLAWANATGRWASVLDLGIIGVVFAFIISVGFYLAVVWRRLSQNSRMEKAYPVLFALRWLLLALNVAVLLVCATQTTPHGGWDFCWKTGNDLEYWIKSVVYAHLLPYLAAFPWAITVASALVSASVYLSARYFLQVDRSSVMKPSPAPPRNRNIRVPQPETEAPLSMPRNEP
jgi:predicted Ser/Thr protein kinase